MANRTHCVGTRSENRARGQREDWADHHRGGRIARGRLAKLTNPIEIKGDKTEKYLLLSNSHDGKSSVQIKFTPIRVVCQNTLSMALSQNASYQLVHAHGLTERMEQAQAMFTAITREYADIEASFTRFAEVPVEDEKRLDHYLEKVYPEPDKPQDSAKVEAWTRRVEAAKRDRLRCAWLFQNSPHPPVKEVSNTLWAAYNAVTEYVDHCLSAKSIQPFSPAVHLNSIWFGNRATAKVRAFNAAETCEKEWRDPNMKQDQTTIN